MFKFIIYAIGIFIFLSLIFGVSTIHLILRFIFRGRKKKQRKDEQNENKPITQNDRIITYKKKEFETSTAEDVEFEEIKKEEK